MKKIFSISIKSTGRNILTILLVFALFTQCGGPSENKDMSDKEKSGACCDTESSTCKSETSEITCPECGHKEIESLPTDVCVIKYTCKKCGTELSPKKGDCCVYCTYGTHKCPSKQDE